MLKLTIQEIQKKILLFFYKEGLELFKKGSVLKCSIVENDDDFVRLNSRVKDDKEYIQDIKITKDESLNIEGKCSCQIGYNCKHVAAVCLYYQKNLQDIKYSSIDMQINSLEKVNLNEEFYIYKLIDKAIYLYQVKLLKTKVPSKGKKVGFLAHSVYLEDEKDKEILPILRGLSDFDDKDCCVVNFRGKLGNFALKTIIEFKKLYIEEEKIPATLTKTDALTLKFEKNEEDEYVIKVDSDKELISSNPPFFINEKDNTLEEIEIDGYKLEKILSFPPITFKDIPKVANVILKYLDVELETPKEIKTKIIQISPLPRIFLFNDSFKLDFKYDDYISSFYPRRDKKEFFEDDYKITIIKDLQKEENYKKIIEDSFGFNFGKFNNDIFVYLEKNSKKLELWNAFFNSLDKLKNDGWILETSEDFDLVFDESSKIV
jgi:hypothetical protein